MNVFIITQNEPFFIPKMIKYLIYNQIQGYTITGITILAPHRKNKNYIHWFNERSVVYSFGELLISGLLFLYTKLYNKFLTNSYYSVKKIIKESEINEIITEDINSAEFISKILALNIDIIISISCPQLFKEDLLNSAKYCINAHGTLLPRHRGVFGSWWTLFSGDKIGGSTIHTMEIKLDAGDILWQNEFPIEKNDTQYSIAYKTKRDMAWGLAKVLKQISVGNIKILHPKYETSYHRAPTKELGKEFHRTGYKVISLKDIKFVLAKKF